MQRAHVKKRHHDRSQNHWTAERHNDDEPRHSDQQAPDAPKNSFTLNWRLLVGTLIVCAVLAPAFYGWHRHQVGQTANAFLQRADQLEQLEQEEDWSGAVDYLQRYLRMVPDDLRTRIRLARTFDKAATDFQSKNRAVRLFYETVGAVRAADEGVVEAGEQASLQGRLVELLLDVRRFAEAEVEAQSLLEMVASQSESGTRDAEAKDPHALATRALALARYGLFRKGSDVALGPQEDAVGTAFLKALPQNTDQREFAATLARICRSESEIELHAAPEYVERIDEQDRKVPPSGPAVLEPKPAKAEDEENESPENVLLDDGARVALANQTMNGMVAQNPEDAQAYLARFRYRVRYNRPGAEEDLAKAIQLDPSDIAVCLTTAEHALQKAASAGDETEATELQAEAVKHYQRAIESEPENARAYVALGRLHLRDNEPTEAINVWQQGLENVDNRHLMLNLELVSALIDRSQAEDAGQAREDEIEERLQILQELFARQGSRMDTGTRMALQRRFELLQGRWHATQGEYGKAIPLLERVATLVEGMTPQEQRRLFIAEYLLGQCHAQRGEWGKAGRAFEEASARQPNVPAVHKLAAQAWDQAGQPGKVARHLEKLVDQEDSGAYWLELARARLEQQSRVLPRANRDWEPFHRALTEASKPSRLDSLKQPWQVGLLEVRYLLTRGNQGDQEASPAEQARGVLKQLQEKYSGAPRLWASSALIHQRLGDPEAADQAQEKLADLQPDGNTRYLVRSRLLAARGEVEAAREVITQGLQTVPSEQRSSLQLALVALSLRDGKPKQAARELRGLQDTYPENVAILEQLADLAFERGDMQAAEQWETKLREVEGQDGLRWRYERARRLVVQASSANDQRFQEAQSLAQELLAARPSWPPAVLLSAMIHHRAGQVAEAIQGYQEAIRLGERRMSVYERLISLLYQEGRLDDASSYLTQLQEYVPLVENLSGLKILTAARRGRIDQALETARRRAERLPDNARAQAWLGQILTVSGETAEAETAMRKAIKLAPEQIQYYSGLLLLYLRNNREDDARELLQELADAEEAPAAEKHFVMGQVYERMGDREQTEACYRKALERARDAYGQAENDEEAEKLLVSILNRMALFLAGSDLAEAEELAKEAREIDPQNGASRRVYAAILAAGGTEQQWQQAQQLLLRRGGGGDAPSGSLDKRLHAALLVRRGGKENLQQAQRLLEDLIGEGDPAAVDRLLLARLYQAQAGQLRSQARELAIDGRPDAAEERRAEADAQQMAARRQYVSLAAKDDPAAEHVAALVEFLLGRKEYGEAERWMQQLAELAPDDLNVARLRARLLKATGRSDEIPEMLEPVAEKRLAQVREEGPEQGTPEELQQAESRLAATVGRIYREAELHAAAEPWFRQAFDKRPESYFPSLAGCLAAQGQVAEAVKLCRDAVPQDDSSPKLPLVLASLVVRGTASPEELQNIEPELSAAMESHGDNLNLLSSVANIRVIEGKLDEAVKLYERALELDPENLLILNNLATILGEQEGRRDEALQHINKAIELSGPSPALLDSKGVVLFHIGRLEEARQCLEAATWEAGTDPRFFFHLAATYLRLGETDRARQAFQQAQDNNLEQQILTPSDQLLLKEIREEL